MSTYIYYKYFKPAEQEQITSKMAPNSSSPALLKRNNSAKQLYGNNKKVNPELLPIVTMSYNLPIKYITRVDYQTKYLTYWLFSLISFFLFFIFFYFF